MKPQHLALQVGVSGAKHFSHSAFAQCVQDFIRAEAGAGCQGHVVEVEELCDLVIWRSIR